MQSQLKSEFFFSINLSEFSQVFTSYYITITREVFISIDKGYRKELCNVIQKDKKIVKFNNKLSYLKNQANCFHFNVNKSETKINS